MHSGKIEDDEDESYIFNGQKKVSSSKSGHDEVQPTLQGRRFGDKKSNEHFKLRQEDRETEIEAYNDAESEWDHGKDKISNKIHDNGEQLEHHDNEVKPKKSSSSHVTTSAEADDVSPTRK